MSNYTKCPKNHALPHKTTSGECTPVYCIEENDIASASPKKRGRKPKQPQAETSSTASASPVDRAQLRYEMQRQLVKTPDFEGADAVAWAETEMVKMLPDAVDTVKRRLRFGDDKQQDWAAEKILDINGFTKKDVMNGGGAPVIVLNIPASGLPWSTKKLGANTTVDSETVQQILQQR